MDRCPDCGDRKRLGPDGRCAWRAGCEHRQLVERARMAELDMLLEPRPQVEPCDHCSALFEIAVRHIEAATDEARARGLLGHDEAFEVPEIIFDE